MGIELPAELADVAAATGVNWPRADEDAMRAQAGAWRQAAQELTTLAAEADTVAGKALGAMTGDTAEAARQKWSGFVDPDGGRLTTAAQGAQQAADRLDRAAEQVAAAKVEIVRNLVDAARNRDAAMVAAESGHPAALAGLDTVLRGTATNVGAVTSGLVDAVGAGVDGPARPVGDVVNAHPGAHTADGQSGLLSTVTGLPRSVVEDALAGVESAPDALAGLDEPGGQGLLEQRGGPGEPGLLERLGEGGVPGLPEDAGERGEPGGPGLPAHQGGAAPGLPLPGGESGPPSGLPDHLRDHTDLPGPEAPGSDLPAPDLRVPGSPVAGSGDEGTGPIALPDAPTPPSGLAGLPRGFADAPTPPSGTAFPAAASGQTHLAGYSGGPAPAPGAQPMQQPVAPVPPVAQQPYGAPGYAPPFGQPFAGQAGSPVPIAPGPQQPPAPPGQHPAAPPPVVRNAPPGLPPAGPPPAAPGAPRNAPPPMAPPPVVPGPPAAGPRNAPARWGPSAEPHYPQRPPEPVRAQPSAAAVPVGAPRQERESIVALFLVHMFPIGHLPVASDRPARQLPVPARDDATPVRLRCFPPHDHPRSAVVDSGQALAWLRQGWRQPAPPPAEVLPCPPDALRQGYDPLGGLHEREWDSRYLAEDGERVEYVWPPGERYPEGGTAEGEPELLAEGTLLDRFGTAHGRVFAPDGTPFAQRSLPPSYLEAGYRRYRVVREVPMWRTVSAGWFGQPGGGVRYRSVYSAAELVHLGYLADVTFKEVA